MLFSTTTPAETVGALPSPAGLVTPEISGNSPSSSLEIFWALLHPAGTLATGTIVLPLNTAVADGTEILMTSTQTITSLTVSLNGATAASGAPTTLTAGSFAKLRFYQATNSWYRVG